MSDFDDDQLVIIDFDGDSFVPPLLERFACSFRDELKRRYDLFNVGCACCITPVDYSILVSYFNDWGCRKRKKGATTDPRIPTGEIGPCILAVDITDTIISLNFRVPPYGPTQCGVPALIVHTFDLAGPDSFDVMFGVLDNYHNHCVRAQAGLSHKILNDKYDWSTPRCSTRNQRSDLSLGSGDSMPSQCGGIGVFDH